MIVARRVYLYGIAFATIWMLVNGLAGLLEVALEAIADATVGPSATIGSSGYTDRVSFYGALTGLGLITWVIHWGLAARSLSRDPAGESGSALRKLYLYGFVLIGGLILTYQLADLLIDLLELAFGAALASALTTGTVVSPFSMLATTGALWAYHLRVAHRDRASWPEVGAAATIRRWCSYGLAFVGLMVLLFGTAGLLTRFIDLATTAADRTADSGAWLALAMAGRVGWTVTGLVVWVGAWTWTGRLVGESGGPDRERDSVLRKVYLYGVLLIAVSWTVWNVAQTLYVALRSVLIPSQAGALWGSVQRDLGETVAHLVVFGLAWAYHARVVKREAAAAPEQQRQATIRWIYGYIVSLVGGVTFGIGVGGTLATLLDVLVSPGMTRGEYWWQERLSLFATMIVVGLPVWLIPWLRLQREVVASVARRSLARRSYLFLVLGITVLTLLGSGAYTLYQILRVALGESWTASNTSDLIDAASAAVVAGLLLVYHLRVFQHDAALAKLDEPVSPPAPIVSVMPPDDETQRVTAEGMVTLLVVRPVTSDDAPALRERLLAVVPRGVRVDSVQMPESDVTRLVGGD